MIERHGGVAVIRLPDGMGFYERRSTEVVLALTAFAEALHRFPDPTLRGVLLLQTSVAEDLNLAWLEELRDDALLKGLAKTIDGFRWLLSLVRNAPIPWCYAAADDCFGSRWELALSCQRRYWYDPAAQIGFPEIAAGAFPPGGVLESLSKRTGRTKDRWFSQYMFTSVEALGEGLVDFCAAADDWRRQALSMFQQLLLESPKSGVRESRRTTRYRETFDITGDDRARRAAFESLDSVWKQERGLSPRPPSAWDYGWEIVKQRGKIKDPHDLARLIAHIAARHFLSPVYLAWVEASLSERSALRIRPPSAFRVPLLTIDLDFVAPPTGVLLRLFEKGASVVFASTEAKVLAAALNVVFARLERALGAQIAAAHWERRVSWLQGVIDEPSATVLRWAVDDRFSISVAGARLSFLRLEGNAAHSAAGFLEWPQGPGTCDDRHQTALAVAALAADGFVKTDGFGMGAVPVSIMARSLALEELLRMVTHADADLTAVVELLGAAGWRFAGSEDTWGRFLRTRLDTHTWAPDLPQTQGRAPDRHMWELASWKHAKAHARKSYPASGLKWNATAASHHFALYLGLVAMSLARGRGSTILAEADNLCAKALGFPAGFGTPVGFLRRRGRRRVAYYASQHWPDLPFDRLWSLDA